MAAIVTEIKRAFIVTSGKNKIKLEDPNDKLSVDNVKDFYQTHYPQLLNSTVVDKGIVDNEMVYEFQTVAGTKG